jgi:serine/threonine-protein kinase
VFPRAEAGRAVRYRCLRCGGDIPSAAPDGPVVWLDAADVYADDHEPTRDPEVPTLGRYRVQSELGRGGMGVVFAGWDTELRRPVAIKRTLGTARRSPEEIDRFLFEARAIAALEHPNIVRIYDIAADADPPWFTMELVEGRTLRARIQEAPLPREEALRIGVQVARALEHAHRHGIVHRDVKPENILLTVDGRAKLSDFGLAVVRQPDGTRRTRLGPRVGTPGYMTPEQTAGDLDAIGPRSDLRALATVLWELLADAPAYPGPDVLRAIAEDPPPDLRRAAPDVPEAVATVIMHAMARSPDDRYATALAFAEDLERCLAGEPTRGPTRPRSPAPWIVGGAVLVAIAAAIVWAVF